MSTFTIISMFFVLSGFLSAIIIFTDIYIIDNLQKMKIMNIVWILTGLWAGFVGLWAYYNIGKLKSDAMDANMSMPEMDMDNKKSDMYSMDMQKTVWQKTTLSTLHCGSGCTLADIIGEWFIFFVPMCIGWGWTLDYFIALIIGILFQYAAIRPMEKTLTKNQAYVKAFKIDFWSLTSWQVGMYGFMAIMIFVVGLHLERNSWEFWFLMQLAMMCGFVTAYPTNRLLIKLGIKKGM